ncbi:MAG: hypothetical protein HOV83_13340 [Catenulispora sp.]|nr:hypothetical protein [Catenulispora sp.]
MVIAAAVVPHPPVLVPDVARGLAPDLDALRGACTTAIDRLYAAEADELVVVGGGPKQSTNVARFGGFHEYGLDLAVDGRWATAEDAEPMTLPFQIAAWLLRDRPDTPVRRAVMVDADGGLAMGDAKRRALLVLGDGSACRSVQAPGHFDERAEAYDAEVARALATADIKALAGLDPELSRQLQVAGLPAWRALAAVSEGEYDAELLYDEAPYGVGYFVASWITR